MASCCNWYGMEPKAEGGVVRAILHGVLAPVVDSGVGTDSSVCKGEQRVVPARGDVERLTGVSGEAMHLIDRGRVIVAVAVTVRGPAQQRWSHPPGLGAAQLHRKNFCGCSTQASVFSGS